jgi:hypothetical protein
MLLPSCLWSSKKLSKEMQAQQPPGGAAALTGLEAFLPCVEVQGRELAKVGVAHVDVEGLGLVDEGTAVCRHVHQHALLDLPDGLVQVLEVVGDVQVLEESRNGGRRGETAAGEAAAGRVYQTKWRAAAAHTGTREHCKAIPTPPLPPNSFKRRPLTATLPFAATSSFFISASHRPMRVRSCSRCWFTTVNSPAGERGDKSKKARFKERKKGGSPRVQQAPGGIQAPTPCNNPSELPILPTCAL